MKHIIKYQNAEMIFFTDKGNVQSFSILPTSLNIIENVLVIDMASDYSNDKKEFFKNDISSIICLSSNWNIKKLLGAMNFNCKAFLENDSLSSIDKTIKLVQSCKTSVFDNIPFSILNSLLKT